jgi:hypothetical protein
MYLYFSVLCRIYAVPRVQIIHSVSANTLLKQKVIFRFIIDICYELVLDIILLVSYMQFSCTIYFMFRAVCLLIKPHQIHYTNLLFQNIPIFYSRVFTSSRWVKIILVKGVPNNIYSMKRSKFLLHRGCTILLPPFLVFMCLCVKMHDQCKGLDIYCAC